MKKASFATAKYYMKKIVVRIIISSFKKEKQKKTQSTNLKICHFQCDILTPECATSDRLNCTQVKSQLYSAIA